jgi:hypothetical protein
MMENDPLMLPPPLALIVPLWTLTVPLSLKATPLAMVVVLAGPERLKVPALLKA